MSESFIGSTGGEFDGSVSVAVVTAIAERRGVSPTELPPLYDAIDPDAMDALFASTRSGGPRCGRLEFTYDGHEITVECDDGLEIAIDGSSVVEPISAGAGGSAGEFRTDV